VQGLGAYGRRVYRRDIVEINLDRLLPIVEQRHRERRYSIGTSSGSTFHQVVLRLDDLKGIELRIPDTK
jgi:hypothetical protein